MIWIEKYVAALYSLTIDMAFWLLFGFFIAGFLYAFIPQEKIRKFMGGNNFKSVFNAALIGVPLPLCSCGVIPAGVSLFKNGASKGSSVSFLISTPQTGVDSIMVTYSMIGFPFAIMRMIAAFITGLAGGLVTNFFENNKKTPGSPSIAKIHDKSAEDKRPAFIKMLHYGFIEFLQDIAKWLVIGLLIAALIAVILPDDFFVTTIHNEFLQMLIILAASIPLYVCATSSVPIAAVLMMKGLNPGLALVFLMAGPATNAATISVISKVFGFKTLSIYLLTIILGAVSFSLIVDYLLPEAWFSHTSAMMHADHSHGLIPMWLQIMSAIILTSLIVYSLLDTYIFRKLRLFKSSDVPVKNENLENYILMKNLKIAVYGMNCNHCKTNVESNLSKINGITNVQADVAANEVTFIGAQVNMDQVKSAIEEIGYKYGGLKE